MIYEVIKNVEGYQGGLKSEDDAETHLAKAQGSQLKELLAGKTFYAYNKGEEIDKISFNANATTVTWPGGSESIRIDGKKTISPDGSYKILTSHSSEYIELTKYSANGGVEDTSRLYYDKAKAEAYLEEVRGGVYH